MSDRDVLRIPSEQAVRDGVNRCRTGSWTEALNSENRCGTDFCPMQTGKGSKKEAFCNFRLEMETSQNPQPPNPADFQHTRYRLFGSPVQTPDKTGFEPHEPPAGDPRGVSGGLAWWPPNMGASHAWLGSTTEAAPRPAPLPPSGSVKSASGTMLSEIPRMEKPSQRPGAAQGSGRPGRDLEESKAQAQS